ncbi:MAG TPA: PH domain-containing protein [Nitrosopumilaceae archaeon]|nr:PH domain-containing protein [Nitrosopumilaceae archaeon]
MFGSKKEPEYVFDRSQFDADELSEIDRIKNMLDAAEIIKAVARQSKLMPGGKLITPKTIFATDKRLLIRDPNMLGLRSDVDAIPYSQINNVKLEKGVFTSRVMIKSGNFNTDEQGYIDAIPKDKAAKIVAIINEGIRLAQTHTTEVVQQKSVEDDPLTMLKKRFVKGEITKEEFEDMKKMLE